MPTRLGRRPNAVIERFGGVHRRGVMGLLDALAWFMAVLVTSSLAFVESLKAFNPTEVIVLATVAALLQLGAGWATGLYRRAWRAGSVEEVHRVARAATMTTIGLVLSAMVPPRRLLTTRRSIVFAFGGRANACGEPFA